ncbi:MAG: hypothetical protein QOG64_2565 [Acidimicrobiaceae bacterium]|nr:hypothetical protein [Acidimicrobiaceae bacterium]
MKLASLRPIRHRRFAVLLAAGLVSNIGSWMERVGVGTLVFKTTGRAVWATLVAAATFLPIGVLSPVGGALADRLDRRRFLMVTNGVEAGLATVLAVLASTGHATPAAVVAVVFCEGCSSALRVPFQQSLLPDLVPPEDLLGAVALGSAQFNAGRVVGPALAALVISVGSFAAAFTVNAVSFFAVIGALAFIGELPRAAGQPGEDTLGIWSRIRSGARTGMAEPGCRAAIGLIGLTALLVSPFIALIPAKAGLLVGQRARALAAATGLFTTAQGIGAVAGALALAPLAERLGQRRTLVGGLVAAPLAAMLFAVAPNVPLTAVALLFLGAGYIAVLSGLSTVVQLRAPAAARGRVLSLFFVSLGVLYPIGSVVQGALADRVGFGITVGSGASLLLLALAGIGLLRPAVLRALDPTPPAGRGPVLAVTTVDAAAP